MITRNKNHFAQNYFAFFFIMILLATKVWAQGINASAQPDVLNDITIEQKLNEQIPLDLAFRNESGQSIQLSEYFNDKPMILALVYYECPMLCNLVLNGLVKSLKPLSFDSGDQFDVIAVSIDPKETPELAEQKKRIYLKQYNREGAEQAWHFLTGDEQAIKQLADAVGFHYSYDPVTKQFAHAGGIMVVTPQGKLARYFYGIEYASTDLRLALIEASENKIGNPVDQLLLYCYHYDPTTGKYGLVIMNVLRLAGIATVALLGGFIIVMIRRDSRRSRKKE